jgi:hypothetical protein
VDDPKQPAKDEGAVNIARHPGDADELLDMSIAADFHQLLDALVAEYFEDFDEPDKAKYARDQLIRWWAAAELADEKSPNSIR